ncbi:hypothetical protein [uncultured Rubinisphaera sp.]|uniref:hypothetical protein n=1 Tax=uncultured Rubinisphaera sp. TaxID=1678686 RepID=UPI0030DC258F
MKMNPTGFLTRVAIIVMLSTAVGCLADNPEESGHAEHVIPEHKPADYVSAVEQLEIRTSNSLPENSEQRQQLTDIVGWLPELAAQTDLPKADWDRIQELSEKYQALAKQQDAKLLIQEIQADLDELKQLAEKTIELDTFNTYDQKELTDE